MNIILMGAPFSGKGSQGTKLSEYYNIPHISSGNLIRNNIAAKTEIGLKVKDIINKGKLVDDDIITKMVFERLSKKDCENGFILDGYPRTIKQAKILSEHYKIDMAINIEISIEDAIKRVSGRRVCNKCNKTYYVTALNNECCPICGNLLEMRSDDTVEIIKERFEIFETQSKEIIKHYKENNILFDIDGYNSIEMVFASIVKSIKSVNYND